MKRLIHLCQTLLLGALLAGCGSGASLFGASNSSGDGETGHIAVRKEGFALRVLDESYRYGGSADFTLEIKRSGVETTVSISAEAADLRAAYLELEYDSQRLHPLEAVAGAWPVGDREVLHLALLNEVPTGAGRATAYFGAVLPGLDHQPGASGEFEVLSLRFLAGPASNLRLSSKVPNAESSRIPDPAVDTETGTLDFNYYNVGDYNQDGRVAVSDLTPIGIRFGDAVPDSAPNSIEAVVDGSADLKVNVQDLTPIGLNFQAKVDFFNVYLGSDADYADPNNGSALLLGGIPFAPDGSNPDVQRLGDPSQQRLAFRAVYAALVDPQPAILWVRPIADLGAGNLEQGIPSVPHPVSGGGPGGDVTPPVWDDAPNPGIISATSHDAYVSVTWGAATDADSPPVTYRLYYNEGATVNFNSDSYLSFPEGTLSTDVTGLINGTGYAFAVRAADSAVPTPNEDLNLKTLQATPLATEVLPETIDTDTIFETPMLLPDNQTTELQDCAVLTCDHDLTIDGELKAVDCDLYIIVKGKLTVNGKLTLQTSQASPSGGGTDAYSIKIEARGDVEIGSQSELDNQGNFYLVDNSAEFADPTQVVNDTDIDLNPEIYDYTLMNEEPAAPMGNPRQGRSLGFTFNGGRQLGPQRAASAALYHWQVSGDWGQQPAPAAGVQRVVYRIYSNNSDINFSQWNLIGPRGRNASDVNDCSAFGTRGGDAYRLRIHSAELLNFDSCNIGLSEGGRGAAANSPVCCDAFASAGEGGQPGRFRITSFAGIAFQAGDSFLDPGKGGDGGPALAIGSPGLDGCPAENGCQATAEGGDGADVYFGLLVRGELTGLDKLHILPIRGGVGGSATAAGGDGGLNFCTCGGDGGSGGLAVATGGMGGDATFGSLNGAQDGGATSGNGGVASAVGGLGRDGGACIKEDNGGSGGDGGDATAVGGDPGVADGVAVALVQGLQGNTSATGGAGANGGDGCQAGGAGSGGSASATGGNPLQTDGPTGQSGEQRCPVEWFVPLSSLLPPDLGPGPDDIPDGFSGDATLYDTGQLAVVGTVPFVWHVPVAGGAIWDKDLVTNDTFFQMVNPSMDQTVSLELDFSQVDLDSGDTPLGLLSSRLFIRDNHEITATTLGAYLDLRSTPDLNTLFLEALDEITHVPGGDPIVQDFDFGAVYPSPIYRIACPPQWTTAVQLMYIVDP